MGRMKKRASTEAAGGRINGAQDAKKEVVVDVFAARNPTEEINR
jgi:hypothetical protein